jgi:hypothetical protein
MSLLEKDPLARPARAADVATAARALRTDPADGGAVLATGLMPPLADAATAPVVRPDDELDEMPARPRWRGDAYPNQQRTRALLLLVGLAVVVVGALLLVLVNGGRDRAATVAATPTPTATPRPTPSALSLVAGRYVGHKYADVQPQLVALGLKVQRRNQVSAATADTVIGIAPSGPVSVGSTVTVTVATPKPAETHPKHHGPGKGNND